jgi:hypothetical protein
MDIEVQRQHPSSWIVGIATLPQKLCVTTHVSRIDDKVTRLRNDGDGNIRDECLNRAPVGPGSVSLR